MQKPTRESLAALIPYSTAVAAFNGTSMTPERRAEQVIDEFAGTLLGAYAALEGYADDNEDELAILADEWPVFAGRFRAAFMAWLGARSRCLSSMIAGPSNFPKRRAEKANDSADRRADDMQTALAAGMKRIRSKMKPWGDGSTISADDPAAVTKMRAKIARLEADQERMKAANAAYRAGVKAGYNSMKADEVPAEWLAELGDKLELAVDARLVAYVTWQKEYPSDRGPYCGWPLSNLGANIRSARARLAQLEAMDAREASEKQIGAITVAQCPDENRVRLIFKGKPADEIREKLKRNGFKWSPNAGAWQRQMTPQAVRMAEHLAEEIAPCLSA